MFNPPAPRDGFVPPRPRPLLVTSVIPIAPPRKPSPFTASHLPDIPMMPIQAGPVADERMVFAKAA